MSVEGLGCRLRAQKTRTDPRRGDMTAHHDGSSHYMKNWLIYCSLITRRRYMHILCSKTFSSRCIVPFRLFSFGPRVPARVARVDDLSSLMRPWKMMNGWSFGCTPNATQSHWWKANDCARANAEAVAVSRRRKQPLFPLHVDHSRPGWKFPLTGIVKLPCKIVNSGFFMNFVIKKSLDIIKIPMLQLRSKKYNYFPTFPQITKF